MTCDGGPTWPSGETSMIAVWLLSLITGPILVRGDEAALGFDPHEVVVRIERVVAVDPVADLEILRRRRRAIDEVVRVALARPIPGAHPCSQYLFSAVRNQDHLAGD